MQRARYEGVGVFKHMMSPTTYVITTMKFLKSDFLPWIRRRNPIFSLSKFFPKNQIPGYYFLTTDLRAHFFQNIVREQGIYSTYLSDFN